MPPLVSDPNARLDPPGSTRYASLVSEFAKALGRAVEFARRRKDLTQEQLADRADVNRGYLGAIERGERNPTADVLVKLAAALDMRLSDLVRAAEEEMARP